MSSKTLRVKKEPEMGRDLKCLSARSLSRSIKEFKVRLSKQPELEKENATFNTKLLFVVFKNDYSGLQSSDY